MSSIPATRATLDDLYREEGKAELIGGRIIRYMPSGDLPSAVAFEIAVSLRAYARHRGVSLRAVQKAIQAGRIETTPAGKVDVQIADTQWDPRTAPRPLNGTFHTSFSQRPYFRSSSTWQ